MVAVPRSDARSRHNQTNAPRPSLEPTQPASTPSPRHRRFVQASGFPWTTEASELAYEAMSEEEREVFLSMSEDEQKAFMAMGDDERKACLAMSIAWDSTWKGLQDRLNSQGAVQQNFVQLKKLSVGPTSTTTAKAAEVWDRRYHSASLRMVNVHRDMERHPGFEPTEAAFRDALEEVFRVRYFLPDRLEAPPLAPEHRQSFLARRGVAKEAIFDPDNSFWTPRIAWSDGQSLYDTSEVKLMRFEQDVRRAIRLGLVKLVVHYDDDGAIDLDEDGIPDEVEEVAVVLWEHYDFICSLFTSYAILNSNLSFLTLDSWSALVKDCKFTSAHTRYSKHSPVFIASDHTKEDMLERTDPVNATALATLVDDGPLTDEGSMEIEHKMSEVPTGAPSAEELRRRVEELQDAVDAVAVMKLAEMREALASRDLDTSGKKATLAERLVATLLADLAAAEVEAASHEESESERKNKYAAMVAGVVSKASLTKAKASRWRRASSERTIGRADLMIRLISIAIRKYVVTGKIYDVSEAVEKLLHVDMLLRLGVGRFPDPDAVRRSFCYTPSMCMVLERYEPTLRRIFDAVAQGKPTMPLDSWLSFLGVMQFIGKDVSAHDAARSFAWSRMVVVHGSSSKGAIKENQLPFEGFVEALIRVSILKALTTLEDIDEDGSVDVVEYMGRMTPGQMVHSEFLELRAAPWGEPPKLPHVDLRIEMLVRLAVNRIRLVLKARSSGQLETARVSKWRKVGRKKPTAGGEIVNKALASGLCAKLRFTRAELDRFKVPQELKAGTFIQVGSEYFAYVGLIEPFRQLSEQEVQEWHKQSALRPTTSGR